VIADMTRMAALSRVAASAILFWSSEIVFSAALSFMLSALSFWAMRLYIYGNSALSSVKRVTLGGFLLSGLEPVLAWRDTSHENRRRQGSPSKS
jgi:hypothetical protein